MKKLLSSLLIVNMLSLSSAGLADETTKKFLTVDSTTQVVEKKAISPLKSSQPAPYSGILLSPVAVAQLIAKFDSCSAETELAVKKQFDDDAAMQSYQLKKLSTTCDADKSIVKAQLDSAKAQNALLEEQLKKISNPPSAMFWAGIGGIGGVVVTILTVVAVSKATK
jgi:hypothetical protein